MQKFRVDLKTFTNVSMLSESKYLAEFLGKKPQTLLIPIYTTVYDNHLSVLLQGYNLS